MKPLPPEMLQQIEALTREAMGFSTARGDSLNITNSLFTNEVQLKKHLRYLKAHNLLLSYWITENTAYCHYCLVYVAFRYQTSMG